MSECSTFGTEPEPQQKLVGHISKKCLEDILKSPRKISCFIDKQRPHEAGEILKFKGDSECYLIISLQKNIYFIVPYYATDPSFKPY